MAGTAVRLTAAAVPSHKRVDSNVEMLRGQWQGDRAIRYNGCSDGVSADSGGLGKGQKDVVKNVTF